MRTRLPSDPVIRAALTKKPSSGEHPAVRTYHAQLEAIERGQMPVVREVTERMRASLEQARRDPRREPEADAEEVPVDVVTLPLSTRPAVPRPAPRARPPLPSRPGEDR